MRRSAVKRPDSTERHEGICPVCGQLMVRQFKFPENVEEWYCHHCHMFVDLDDSPEDSGAPVK